MSPTQDKVCILCFWALLLMYAAAQRQYFPQSSESTWEGARSHCQICFKDLVTLTPENIQMIVQNLSSDYWIGLRKTFNSSSSNSSRFWSRWANGDPLTFQNWFPGQPVMKSRVPKRYDCSCTYTCPSRTRFTTRYSTVTSGPATVPSTSTHTGSASVTGSTAVPPVTVECVKTSMASTDDSEIEEDYSEDACAVLLSFGAWVEKNCSELLPFICYDDHFFGKAQVVSVTATNATVTWEEGPSAITHYRVEVRRPREPQTNVTNLTTTDLVHHLHSLTAGTRYSVQVFPVKCGRDLKPQNATFYTVPNKVKNLNVTHVTDTSVSLRWDKPDGNTDLYLIKSPNLPKPLETPTEEANVSGLEPGSPYTFSVFSVVKDLSKWSKEFNISAYTKPQRVSNLRVADSNESSMVLCWDRPAGRTSGFLLTVSWSGELKESITLGQNVLMHPVHGLPSGTEITLGVRGLTANNTVEADEETVVNHTAPIKISRLTLETEATSLTATWEYPQGNGSFTVELWLNDKLIDTRQVTNQLSQRFDGLRMVSNYTVYVYSVSGHLRSQPEIKSNFTFPQSLTELKAVGQNKTHITFEWKPPDNTETFQYAANLSSSFWGQHISVTLKNKTTHTFGGLTSGTNYRLEMRTVAGNLQSKAETVSHFTDADKREISLSMMCSSETPLLCDERRTRESVFQQLKSHFNDLLGHSVSWELRKVDPGNAEA